MVPKPLTSYSKERLYTTESPCDRSRETLITGMPNLRTKIRPLFTFRDLTTKSRREHWSLKLKDTLFYKIM